MHRACFVFAVCLLIVPGATLAQRPSAATSPAAAYFPDRFDWEHKNPQDVGMDSCV